MASPRAAGAMPASSRIARAMAIIFFIPDPPSQYSSPSGGAGVFRSHSWYKAQLDGMSFISQQAVYDLLDSIYQPL